MDVHGQYKNVPGIPVFVKEGAFISLIKPVPCVGDTVFEMTIRTFGEADAVFILLTMGVDAEILETVN